MEANFQKHRERLCQSIPYQHASSPFIQVKCGQTSMDTIVILLQFHNFHLWPRRHSMGRIKCRTINELVWDPVWGILGFFWPTCNMQHPEFATDRTLYRGEIYSLQILLIRTQAGPGRAVKEQQEQNSPNHVQRINLPSVYNSCFAARQRLNYIREFK